MPQKPSNFQSKSSKGGGKFSDRKPGGARGGKGGFSKRSEGDRSYSRGDGDRKPAGKSFGGKKFGAKSYGDRPARDGDDRREGGYARKPAGKSFGDKKFGDKKFGPKKFGDKPFRERDDRDGGYERKGGKSFGDKKFGDKKFGPKKFGDKPFRERDDRDGGYERKGGKSFGDKKFGDKKFGPKKFGDKPFRERDDRDGGYERKGGKSFGDKKFGDKKFGPKKFGDKKPGRFDDRGDRGDRPYMDRSRTWSRKEEPQRGPATEETQRKLKSGRASYGSPSPNFLFGVHPVTQALLNGERAHNRLLVTEKGFAAIEDAYNQARDEGLTLPEVTYVEQEDIERLLPREAVHQDVLLDTAPLEDVFLSDILLHADDNTFVVMLDQVTDPHNVGAILRSAAAFGAAAVIVQKLHAPDITGTLAKSASGAVEHVPLVREVNLSRTLEQLKDAGFTCIGLDERGESTLAKALPKGKVAIVLGNEGDGLRRLVAENCDYLAQLPTQGEIASLNVSNASAIALYEIVRARR